MDGGEGAVVAFVASHFSGHLVNAGFSFGRNSENPRPSTIVALFHQREIHGELPPGRASVSLAASFTINNAVSPLHWPDLSSTL